jgi:hypothetical protein
VPAENVHPHHPVFRSVAARIGVLLVLTVLPTAAAAAAPSPPAFAANPASAALRARATALPYSFTADAYGVRLLPSYQLGFPAPLTVPRDDSGVHDADGVRLIRVNGRLYDSPGGQAAYGVANLNTYRLTGDRFFLDRALAQARRLLDEYEAVGDAWYFPHRYPKDVHWKNGADLRAPWYSAMTQGYALGLFAALWEETRDPVFRTAADATFASFLRAGPQARPWTVAVDDGFLWLEEWPHRPLDHALNGHVFAAWGLYEYYRQWRDERALEMFRGAVTTVVAHIDEYRRPGWLSRYCLAHLAANARYHAIHIWQLRSLYTMTGDARFARLADLFVDDYPPSAVSGRLHVTAGRHHGFRFSAAGRIVGHKVAALAGDSGPVVSRRERIRGRAGVWFRIVSGPLRGYWVAEDAGTAFLPGRVVTVFYAPWRSATLESGHTYHGFDFRDDGSASATSTVTVSADTPAAVDARSVINGVPHVHMTAGPLAGFWVPLAGVALD